MKRQDEGLTFDAFLFTVGENLYQKSLSSFTLYTTDRIGSHALCKQLPQNYFDQNTSLRMSPFFELTTAQYMDKIAVWIPRKKKGIG